MTAARVPSPRAPGDLPAAPPGVRVEPLARCLPGFARVLAPWSVVVLGRRVCVVAQRVPPLVLLVRSVAGRREAQLWTAGAADGTNRPH